jgi:hypothetical protein
MNGKEYIKTYITHEDVMNGGKMRVVMGNKPNYDFEKLPDNRPPGDL